MKMPLSGFRILDMSQILSGPACTRMLGDLGAEIIKVEFAGAGDGARRAGTSFLNGESLYYLTFNRNKKGITLNLQTEDGREIFKRLAVISDAVLDNFRPGVTTRLGVDFNSLKKVNPSIVCCSISGYGKDGPYSQRPVFDSVIQGVSGAMSVTGEPGRPPAVMGFAVTDIGGAYGTTVGLLTALLARERTGQGQEVDLSLLDIQLTFQGHLSEMYLGRGAVPGPGGSVQSANLPNGAFQSKDGKYMQIHCATQKFWDVLAEYLAANVEGQKSLPQDEKFLTMDGRRKNWDELKLLLENAFATKNASQWMEILGNHVPISQINTVAEALQDPQVLHRNMVIEVDHPVAGKHRMPGNPIKMGQEEVFRPAPTLGQHNREVLGGLLGYSDSEIEALTERGIV